MTSTVGTLAWLVLLAPLFGALTIAVLFRQLSGRAAGALATTVLFTSFGLSVATLFALQSEPEDARQVTATLWDYAVTSGLDVKLSLLVDPLAVIMMLVVSGVSALIHLYATAYMVSDEGYNRFFAYLNLFVFSMLVLVLAGNLVLLTVGWGLVGMASYLLISFWYRRQTATKAGVKAFSSTSRATSASCSARSCCCATPAPSTTSSCSPAPRAPSPHTPRISPGASS